MARRSRAREVALQALHQLEFNQPDGDPSGGDVEPAAAGRAAAPLGRSLRGFIRGRLRSIPLIDFAEALVTGVSRSRADLDRLLDTRSANWRVSRMAATDRTVLRLAVYELLLGDTPGPVVVDEAIELAKRYGSASSPRFIAGILGGILADPPASLAPVENI
jgi:N utilization substance protein B